MEKVKKYRYKMEIPELDYSENGFPKVYCSPSVIDWEKLTWRRFGSGGESDARHCFVDDWRIEHLWRRLGQGLAKALIQGIMTAPDFSVYPNYPLPVAAYQIWRSNTVARYWQNAGVIVVPVLQWGSPETIQLSSLSIKTGSVVAVRGPQLGTEKKYYQVAEQVKEYVKPKLVLNFGRKAECWDTAIYLNLRNGR